MIRVTTAALLAGALVAPALAQTPAADCPLGEALYRQAESEWTLVFMPVPEANAGGSFTNAFAFWIPGSDLSLTGTINWTNGYTQPWGEIFLQCEEGADPASCRVWEGAVYELRGGVVNHVASEADPSPEQVLFPDLGASLWYSNLRQVHGIENMPWDVFTYSECAP